MANYRKNLKDRGVTHEHEPLVYVIENNLPSRLGMYERHAILEYLDDEVDLISLYVTLVEEGVSADVALYKMLQQLEMICVYFECVDMEGDGEKTILCH